MTKKAKQARLFTHEDLPLFSGLPTPPPGRDPGPAPDPPPVDRQETWAKCRFCLDTGQAEDRFCWCEAGEQARLTKRRERVFDDVRFLSSGTLATLTGLSRYNEIEPIHHQFIQFALENGGLFDTWQDAWASFWPTHKRS